MLIPCSSYLWPRTDNVFHFPYDIYVDPSRALYRALGMTRRTTDGGAEAEKGDYVVHGAFGGIGMVLKNALKMPIGQAGDIKQLGGEFLFGPGIRADYCHRMPTTRGHTAVKQLLKLAHVEVGEPSAKLLPRLDVRVEDSETQRRKDAWDEFIRWTQERRWGSSSSEINHNLPAGKDAYPYAFADRELWQEHGGCGEDGTDAGTLCSRSIRSAPSAAHFPKRDSAILRSWGLHQRAY